MRGYYEWQPQRHPGKGGIRLPDHHAIYRWDHRQPAHPSARRSDRHDPATTLPHSMRRTLMNGSNRKERGQALVLIVFAIVGLIGLTGLAIDGGNAYSDRRHAQNAADTAALAAALSKTHAADQATWEE